MLFRPRPADIGQLRWGVNSRFRVPFAHPNVRAAPLRDPPRGWPIVLCGASPEGLQMRSCLLLLIGVPIPIVILIGILTGHF